MLFSLHIKFGHSVFRFFSSSCFYSSCQPLKVVFATIFIAFDFLLLDQGKIGGALIEIIGARYDENES